MTGWTATASPSMPAARSGWHERHAGHARVPRARRPQAGGVSAAPATRASREPARAEALDAALSAGARPPRPSALSACLTFGWRGMLKIKHVPEQLLDVTLTPVLFLLMFTYLFGGAIEGSTGEYLQFVLPGILVQSVLFTTVYSGVTLNTDVTKGVVDRFRSLPLWRPAPLVGAVLGDSVRYLVAAAVVLTLGLVLGYRAEGGVAGVLAAILLVAVFAFALSWVFTSVGLVLRSPTAVLNGGFMVLFPVSFLSNVFVDPDTLPSGLEAFVNANPISHLVTAARGLMDGTAAAGQIGGVLLTAAALTAVFAPLTVRLYRNRG
jgi:ABC-2 type transport system permease protein